MAENSLSTEDLLSDESSSEGDDAAAAENIESESETDSAETDLIEVDIKFLETESLTKENVIKKNYLFLSRINKPRFEDITPMINSTVPFLIDVDSLMLSALNQDNYKLTLGGQLLHMIYYCERVLDIFLQRGGNFILVFFDIWTLVWDENWYLQTCRLALYNHFKHNTNFRVATFRIFYEQEFGKFIEAVKPRCILLNLSTHVDVNTLDKYLKAYGDDARINVTRATRLFCGELTFFLTNDLPCIDIDQIQPDVSTVSSFHLDGPPCPNALRHYKSDIKCDFDDLHAKTLKTITLKHDYESQDARHVIVIIAASEFMKTIKDEFALKLFVLCYAAQEVLPLENRGCPNLDTSSEHLSHLLLDIHKWHKELYFTLRNVQNLSLNWNTIADLWQGTLFNNICFTVTKEIVYGDELGSFRQAYENLIDGIAAESNIALTPYPIKPFEETGWCKLEVEEQKPLDQVALEPIRNVLVEKFCGNIFEGVRWTDPSNVFGNNEFDELRHWHSRKPMSDESDHIISTIPDKPSAKCELKRYDRHIGNNARYMNIYGRSLEGNRSTSETIVCRESKATKGVGSKKVVKIKNESKKAKEIKERNQKDQYKLLCEKETAMFTSLKSTVTKHADLNVLKRKLDEINVFLQKVSTDELIFEGRMLKLQILSYICKHVYANATDVDLNYVKQVFLTIRDVLKMKKDSKLIDKYEKLISTLLHQFGFDEIAQMNKLPAVECKTLLKLDWVRYQLQHIGPELERDENGVHDTDIGFAPDPWQVQFINAIRKNQSALVVAPTSSGKTFASYYCMKRVLQETKDGIVVYVSPTKALVNQVAATMYYRFSNVKLDDGIAAVGIFTRDFKTNATNSRILVTVPQCLDILLLSPRRYGWLKKIRYVIFDEVHRLSGNVEGLVWERCMLMIRCPFLALSATINEPEYFHAWLQRIENFKHEQDVTNNSVRANGSYRVSLIVHSERHSDLVKYTYGSRGLLHYHPYCALNNIAFNIYKGIPSTVTLSPFETLQLFEAIRSSTDSKEILPSDLHPEVYFKNNCSTGFLKRQTVREYENKLGNVFYETYESHKDIYERIVNELNSEDNAIESYKDVQNLLDDLEREKMLPTIVFSYDRKLIEHLHKTVTDNAEGSLTTVDRRTAKKNDQIDKKIKKQQDRLEAKSKIKDLGASKSKPLRTLNILKDTDSKFKGLGLIDSADIKFIEGRLLRNGFVESHPIIQGFQHGFAYHHAGLNNRIRSSVEMLFRIGIVKVVFATGTLALGIHMPCKSIVVFGDSPWLNSLEYHQMSGRAGRRGFDIEGKVVFTALPKKRRDMLMTDKLPKMMGNYPISVTLVLRLLLLVNKVTEKNCQSEEANKITLSCALTLLENSLIFQSKPSLKEQIKHFVGFATQLLLMQNIIGSNGTPLQLGGLVIHLHYHEPSNLALAYLLRTGALRQLVTVNGNDMDIQWSLIVVLSHLFARLRLHKTQLDAEFKNSVVILEPLPEVISKALKQYNKQVKFVFDEYFQSISKSLAKSFGSDDTLPLSKITFRPLYKVENDTEGTISSKIKDTCISNSACSAFIALSGHGDRDLFTESLINNIRHEICPDINVIPLVSMKAQLNSYAADFYRHGIRKAIVVDNGLKGGEEFTRLKDFALMLKVIDVSLDELEPINGKDPLVRHFKAVSTRFELLFNKAFPKGV